jgi:CheY-like chemotaxis protein
LQRRIQREKAALSLVSVRELTRQSRAQTAALRVPHAQVTSRAWERVVTAALAVRVARRPRARHERCDDACMRSVSDPDSNPEPESRSDVLKLLIVEDEVSTVFAMREFFSFTGYQVDCVTSAAEAACLLERLRYDVVITDLHLTPNRCAEGMSVLARARSLSPQSLIVMLTAYGTEGSEREAYETGVNLYETKPVGLADLAARIEDARHNRAHAVLNTGEECGGGWPR